jgi:hypothetical protein
MSYVQFSNISFSFIVGWNSAKWKISLTLHLIDLTCIHFLRCVHGNERIGTHYVVCNTFVAIAWDVGFHMRWKQLHALLSNMFNSYWWIDIVLTKDDIHTFIDVVITDPTWTNSLPRSCPTQGFIVFDVTQAKKQRYHEWHLSDQFLPLVMKIFGCLHKQVDVFLHNYANAI